MTQNASGDSRQNRHHDGATEVPARRDKSADPASTATALAAWSPWRHLREGHPEVRVFETELPPGYLGCTDHDQGIIWLDSRLTRAEQRCTLAHELAHLERGPLGDGDKDADEQACDEWAARRLVPLSDLMAALRWCSDLRAVAEELWVDKRIVQARLECLTATERERLPISARQKLSELPPAAHKLDESTVEPR